MSSYSVVTSFNEKYWLEIARKNTILLDSYWPEKYQISLYHQLPFIEKISDRVRWYDLYDMCPELSAFANKYKYEVKANGAGNTNFRLNAIKFCHKTFAIWHQAKLQPSGWLIWLDCDVIVKKCISDNFLKAICPNGYAVSFMGRPGKYSECGFIGFNLDRTESRQFLLEWEDLYISGKFLELSETHDSWTFDWIRKQKSTELFFNVNAAAITNKNPFSQSLLGSYMAHAKGADKARQTERIIGRSM